MKIRRHTNISYRWKSNQLVEVVSTDHNFILYVKKEIRMAEYHIHIIESAISVHCPAGSLDNQFDILRYGGILLSSGRISKFTIPIILILCLES